MAYVIKGQWGLNAEGIFQEDPWFIADSEIKDRGFGNPPSGFKVRDAGEGVILPGLVNAHAHMELSHLKNNDSGKKGVHGFALDLMREPVKPFSTILKHAQMEMEYACSRGTFFFCDISNNPEFILSLNQMKGFSGIQFYELLGFCSPADQNRIAMANSLMSMRSNPGSRLIDQIYVTPHSLYGSSPDIMLYVLSKNSKLASIHALEDTGEIDLFSGKGNTYEFLKSIQQYYPHPELANENFFSCLEKTFRDIKKLLLVHLVSADDRFFQQIESRLSQSAMVLCHRSNVFLGYQRTNWKNMANSTLPLLIGTDSAASSPDLSTLDEIISLIGEDQIPASRLWQGATYAAYDYLEIHQNKIPFYRFPGTTPDISTFRNASAENILKNF